MDSNFQFRTRQGAVSRLRQSFGPIDCRRGGMNRAASASAKINREVSAARGAHSPPNEAPALSAGHRGTESLRTFGSGTARRVDEGDAPRPRTASSNPFPSSGESANFRSLSGRRNPSRAQLLAHCEGKHRDRRLVGERRAGVVMGVDVARFGDVASVIRFRRGRDARSILPIKLRGADTIDRGSPGAIRKEHW